MTAPQVSIQTPGGSDLVAFLTNLGSTYDSVTRGTHHCIFRDTATGDQIEISGAGFAMTAAEI